MIIYLFKNKKNGIIESRIENEIYESEDPDSFEFIGKTDLSFIEVRIMARVQKENDLSDLKMKTDEMINECENEDKKQILKKILEGLERDDNLQAKALHIYGKMRGNDDAWSYDAETTIENLLNDQKK